MNVEEIVSRLEKMENAKNIAGMARFGITGGKVLGISIPTLRGIAREIGRDHALALKLWKTGIHEARLLAGFIDIPSEVTEKQMEDWAAGFESWDVCDQVCSNLFDKTPFAYAKAKAWAVRDEEFVKRAGFSMMAMLAVHDKKADDATFIAFFPLIKKAATDERNFVKKAVNWAIRQIGKRNKHLQKEAIAFSEELEKLDSKAAKWIAKDALRELRFRTIIK